MKFNFSFNPATHNFWPVYDAIKKFYPIGLQRTDCGLYFEYPGIVELGKIVVGAIHDGGNKQYYKWTALCEKISSRHQIKFQGTTVGQAPSFSADFFLEDINSSQLRKIKKISVAVSLVGKFFAIYGIDETIVTEYDDDGSNLNYSAINVITASPYLEFASYFLGIKTDVDEQFKDFKFLPFSIHSTVINGLQINYSDRKECTIFHALFNEQLDLNSQLPIRGDQYFGFEDWVTEDPKFPEITILPPEVTM